MKVYLAGKITGDTRYRAKFRDAAKVLEAAGYVVLNPAILPAVILSVICCAVLTPVLLEKAISRGPELK